jgi:hypothetical protein
MREGSATGLAGMLGQMGRVRVMVEGVAVLGDCAAMTMAGDDVGRMHGMGDTSARLRIVGRGSGCPMRVRAPMPTQDALDRGQTGHGGHLQAWQVGPNRAMATQSILRRRGIGRFEELPDSDDSLLDRRQGPAW